MNASHVLLTDETSLEFVPQRNPSNLEFFNSSSLGARRTTCECVIRVHISEPGNPLQVDQSLSQLSCVLSLSFS